MAWHRLPVAGAAFLGTLLQKGARKDFWPKCAKIAFAWAFRALATLIRKGAKKLDAIERRTRPLWLAATERSISQSVALEPFVQHNRIFERTRAVRATCFWAMIRRCHCKSPVVVKFFKPIQASGHKTVPHERPECAKFLENVARTA